jgi:transcriptional regulator with XRE-family HTH domain
MKLVKSLEKCQVKGLFLFMYLNDMTMNDVAADTGVSRQTLSTWKKGGNYTHRNVERVAQHYNREFFEFYNATTLLNNMIEKESDYIIRARLGEYLAEYTYLSNAHAETTSA